MTNPILDELHHTREKLLADAGGTMEGLVARLQEEERASDRRFVEPRRSRAVAVDSHAPERSRVGTAARPS